MSSEDYRRRPELNPEDVDRARKAMRAVELADEKLAEGSEFKKAKSFDFYQKTRIRVQKYGPETIISIAALEWLQDIAEQELKRVRKARSANSQ